MSAKTIVNNISNSFSTKEILELTAIIKGEKVKRAANLEAAARRLADNAVGNGIGLDFQKMSFEAAKAYIQAEIDRIDAGEPKPEPKQEVVKVQPKAKKTKPASKSGRTSLKKHAGHPALITREDVLNGEARGFGSQKDKGRPGVWIYANEHGHKIEVTNKIDWADAPEGYGWHARTEYNGQKFEVYAGSVFGAASKISQEVIAGSK